MGLVRKLKSHVATDPTIRGNLSAEALEAADAALEVPGAALWIVNEALARNRKAKRKAAAMSLSYVLSTDTWQRQQRQQRQQQQRHHRKTHQLASLRWPMTLHETTEGASEGKAVHGGAGGGSVTMESFTVSQPSSVWSYLSYIYETEQSFTCARRASSYVSLFHSALRTS